MQRSAPSSLQVNWTSGARPLIVSFGTLAMTTRRKLIFGTVLLLTVLVAVPLIVSEWRHYRTYGHVVSYGLHVDALNEDFTSQYLDRQNSIGRNCLTIR